MIIQNAVEIGAGTTIDRGALNDTVIGEGSKIDNLVQIGHNVTIGRNCIVVSQCGIAGSSTLGEGVILGARAGVSDHATIGDGAQIAGAQQRRRRCACWSPLGWFTGQADQTVLSRIVRGRTFGPGRKSENEIEAVRCGR